MNKHHLTIAKKAISVLCTLALCTSTIPTSALAEALEDATQGQEPVAVVENEPQAEEDAGSAVVQPEENTEEGQEAGTEQGDNENKQTVDDSVSKQRQQDESAEGETALQDEVAGDGNAVTEDGADTKAQSEEAAADEGQAENTDKTDKDIELIEQALAATVYANASKKETLDSSEYSVELEGMLPVDAEVIAWPVEKVNVKKFDLLTAYEIQILVDGKEWQPTDKESVRILIDDEATRGLADANTDEIVVMHIHGKDVEKLEVEATTDGTMSFETESFSTFALGAPLASKVIPTLDKNKRVDGVTYTLDAVKKTASVCTVAKTATVHHSVQYAGVVYKVTYLGCKANYVGNTVYLDDDLVAAMYGGAQLSLPTPVTTTDELDGLEGYAEGANNFDSKTKQKMWKKAEYNSETNQIDISLAYFQPMEQKALDFVFTYDMSDTMWGCLATLNGYTAERAVWASAALQMMAKSLLESDAYTTRVRLIPFTSKAEGNSGWLSRYDDVKVFLAKSWVGGATDHGNAVNEAIAAVKSSKNTPVAIYISDIVTHIGLDKDGSYYVDGVKHDDYTELRNLRKAADGRVFVLKIFNGDSKEKAVDWTANYDHVKLANDVDAFITGLRDIVKEAIGYYIDDSTVVTDELSSGLMNLQKGITLPGGGAGGSVKRSGSTLTWALKNGTNRLQAGKLYKKTISIAVDADKLISGSMPTNGDCKAKVDGKVVNSVIPPVLARDFTFSVACNVTGDPINGVSFELRDSGDAVVWSGTSENGSLTIPFDQVSFPAKSTYTLRQTATDATHLLPQGSWKLSVGSDYVITPSTIHAAGYDASKPNETPDWMVDATVVKGSLVIKNQTSTALSIVNAINGSSVAGSKPVMVLGDVKVNGISALGTKGAPVYVKDDGAYTYLPTYAAADSTDVINGELALAAGKGLDLVVIDQPAGTGYGVNAGIYQRINGTYVPSEGTFSVAMDDSSTNATVTSANGTTTITDADSHVKGHVWNLALTGTLPTAGTKVTVSGSEFDSAYLRLQNTSRTDLKFRVSFSDGAYGNQAKVVGDAGNMVTAKGGFIVEETANGPRNVAATGTDGAHAYEFEISGDSSDNTHMVCIPFAADRTYAVQVFQKADAGSWIDITGALEDYKVKLCDKADGDSWVSDELSGTLVAGPALAWTSADDNSFVAARTATEGGAKQLVNINVTNALEPDPPAPTSVETRTLPPYLLSLAALAVAAASLFFAHRLREEREFDAEEAGE